MKPSDFTNFPCSSVLRKCEAEQVAVNIMLILARTGDIFRDLSLEEYIKERNKDKDKYSNGEEKYFRQVLPYCKSADTAILFSTAWQKTVQAQPQTEPDGNLTI